MPTDGERKAAACARAKRDRELDPEKYRARDARYRTANPDKMQVKWRRWYDLNRDRHLAAKNARRAGTRAAECAARRARLSGATDRPPASWLATLLAAGCEYCSAEAVHIDHMVPLTRGGGHTWRNLTGSCEKCNLTKGTKVFPTGWTGVTS